VCMCCQQLGTHEHMEFIKNLLGIKKLEKRISQNEKEIKELEKITKSEQVENRKKEILQILKIPKSTMEISKKLKISRSHTSKILNQLEKMGEVFEHSKRDRTILYKRKHQ